MYRKFRKAITVVLAISLVICSSAISAYALDSNLRIAGGSRYQTAIEISKAGWSSSENVVLAYGEDFPDALCAAPLARLLDAPILLSEKASLRSDVEEEIKRLGAQNVYIVGGSSVISDAVKSKLENMQFKCNRIFGSDRYSTSTEVAKYMEQNFNASSDIMVATGTGFSDALSIAPVAAVEKAPIVLSAKNALPDTVKKYITENGVTKAYIIGGTGVISDTVKNSFTGAERICGDDRFKTNKAIVERFEDELNFGTTYLATGLDFPDALAGSALAPKTMSPIVLTDKLSDQTTKDTINEMFGTINQVKVLGGNNAVSDSCYNSLVPVIVSIDSINDTVNEGDSYTLPSIVTAKLSNNLTKQYCVSWEPNTVDTSTPGQYTFYGTVADYQNKVALKLTVNGTPQIIKHSLIGEPEVTAEQMANFILTSNYPDPKINPSFSDSTIPSIPYVDLLTFCKMYLEEGAIEGIRGDIAFAQSIHETGYFQFGGQVLPQQYNYAGIGATNGSPVGYGAWFQDQRQGIRAQIQHLKAYASTQPLNQVCVDPRYSILAQYGKLGTAPNLEDLAGKWAVPGYDKTKYSSLDEAMLNNDSYGQSIYKILQQIKAVQVP